MSWFKCIHSHEPTSSSLCQVRNSQSTITQTSTSSKTSRDQKLQKNNAASQPKQPGSSQSISLARLQRRGLCCRCAVRVERSGTTTWMMWTIVTCSTTNLITKCSSAQSIGGLAWPIMRAAETCRVQWPTPRSIHHGLRAPRSVTGRSSRRRI